MTYPAIDWLRNGTSTPSKYRFVLSFVLHSEIGNLELKNAPIEWANIELLLKRDPEMHGVYITAVVNSLTFIKEGKQLLEELYAAKGVFSICDLFIYYLDHTTRTYVSMPSSYKLDFNTYKLVNLTRSTNGIQINALPTDIISKFQQRKNTVVDLNKLVNIDNGAISPYTGIWKSLSIPAISVNKTAKLATSGTGNISGGTTGNVFIYIPLTKLTSEIAEVQTQTGGVSATPDHTKAMIVDEILFQPTEAENITNVRGTVNLILTSITAGITSLQIGLSVTKPDNTEHSYTNIQTWTSGYTGTKVVAINSNVVVPATYSLSLILIINYSGAHSYNISFNNSAVTLTQLYITATSITAESWPIYEAIERNLQHILGQQFPFYSEFFGRTDTAYNIAGDFYASESQLRYANLLTGLNIRGGLLADHTFPVKFTDLFKALRAGWAVGGGFQGNITDGFIFRIEELSHFYQEVEVLDLSARVNEIEIEREQYSEAMFAQLKSGYSKFEYEAIMGRGEYNTANERTTIVPNDNDFDNVSPLRADTRGVLAMRLKPYISTETEDVTGDDDIFLIKSQRGSGYWNSELEENVAVEDNTSLFDKSLNLYLTPTRNLIRNGQQINSGMALVPGATLQYQTSDKNNQLRTTGEGYTISENEDITASNMAPALWYPELLTVTLPFYEADYVTLTANPLGYIKLSETLSGWVMDIKWKFAGNEATIVLIRRIIPLPS